MKNTVQSESADRTSSYTAHMLAPRFMPRKTHAHTCANFKDTNAGNGATRTPKPRVAWLHVRSEHERENYAKHSSLCGDCVMRPSWKHTAHTHTRHITAQFRPRVRVALVGRRADARCLIIILWPGHNSCELEYCMYSRV